MLQGRCQDRRPEAVVAALTPEPVQIGKATLLDAVAELREQRRQHRQRAEHCHGDDHHRRDPEREVRLVAAEEHPGHRDHHGDARDQDRAARRRRRGLECGLVALPRGPLLALALQVEERVVDADGEADQQEHGADVLVHRDQVARQRDETERPEHGREREQQRHACGDDRAEDEQQDQEGQRDRPLPRLRELRVEHVVQRLAGADRTGLADVEVGVGLRHGGGRLRERVDALGGEVVVALHVPLDDRRAAVRRDLVGAARVVRRAQVLDRRPRLHRRDDVVHDGAEGGRLRGESLALDEDDLRLRVGLEAGVPQDVVGAVRLADVGVVLVDLLRADRLPDHQGGGHEGEPAEDRGLPVARAPAAHAGRDVVRALQGGHGSFAPSRG